MNFKSRFCVLEQPKCASASLLFLRLVAGLAFVIHGFGKIQNPMSWMGPEASVPGVLQALAAISEFGGGLAWMAGLLMPLASLGILCTMAVAVSTHIFVMGDPFVSTGGGAYELAAVYLSLAIMFIFVGPGCFSLDAKLFRKT